MMKKNSKKAMYDMVKKMKIGGKNPKKKLSAEAQAAYDAHKAAEAAAAEQARIDRKKGLTAKNGMRVKKAKDGMKVYNNGGKEDPKKLATPEEIKESRRGPQRSRTDDQKKARKEAKKEAKRQARRGAPGTGTGLVKTATTEATGPETLRTGQVRRRGRRLERSAERAGLTKDQAYEIGKAEEALASATESGDKKKAKAANKTIKRQLKYQGQDKKRAIIPVGRKKPAKPGGEEEEKKKKGAIKLRLNRGAKPSSPSTRTNPRRARRPIITRETSGFREHYNRPK